MTVAKADELIRDYAGNTWLIKRHTEGLTHEESLLQPPFPANCLNWILGHIVLRRNSALEVLGQISFWTPRIASSYQSGSAPITSAQEARELPLLLDDLEQTQDRITAALQAISEAELARIVESYRGSLAVWEQLTGLHWHETYHVGQLDLLRSMILANREQQSRMD